MKNKKVSRFLLWKKQMEDLPYINPVPVKEPKLRNLNEIIEAQEKMSNIIDYNKRYYKVYSSEENINSKTLSELSEENERITTKYNIKRNLLSSSDFEWGVINGKLAALNWVLGINWNHLLDKEI